MSQLELSLAAEVSTRHLSFLETGRARPSRAILIKLLEELDMPLRERNRLLLDAGFAPTFAARPYDDVSLERVRAIVDAALNRHRPFPAYAVDRTGTWLQQTRLFHSSTRASQKPSCARRSMSRA